jgi:hypothetical protein
MSWKQDSIAKAITYLDRLVSAGVEDQAEEIASELRDVLDPARRQERLRRVRELDQIDNNGFDNYGQ